MSLPSVASDSCRSFPASSLPAFASPLARCIRADLDEDLGSTIDQEVARIVSIFDSERDFILGHGPEAAPDGFLIAVHDENGGGETSVEFWTVDPAARGRGIGKALLCEAFREAARLGLPSLRVRCLASSASAARVLWDCGFRVVALSNWLFAGRRRECVVFEQGLAGE
ncbi:MAG TPA: GNAT family N-acetyltransferase [Thermoanaerobaculia bacterium]|jgi:ribosomal protein S18 acetylase RimI-like enzyme